MTERPGPDLRRWRTMIAAVVVVVVLVGGSGSGVGVCIAAAPAPSQTKKKVACTLPTIEALVREIGGDRVEVFSLSAGDQDPHAVSPTPSLMKRVREADLLLEIGMQLEPWADDVANGSGNARIFRGAHGRITVSTGIPKRDIPATITRAQGDVHPEGNPHVWLDPARVKHIAENIARALTAVSPADAATFDSRLKDFTDRLDQALFGKELLNLVGSQKLTRLLLNGRLHDFLRSNRVDGKTLDELAGGWLARTQPLRGQKVVEFHKVWGYFAATFAFQIVGTIEEKPGIAPGPRHVTDTTALIKRERVRLILVDNFYDPALAKRIGREGGAQVVELPNQVRGEPKINDYFSLMDLVIDRMLGALRASPTNRGAP